MRVVVMAVLVLLSAVTYADNFMILSGEKGDFITLGQTNIYRNIYQTGGFGQITIEYNDTGSPITAAFSAPGKQKIRVGTYDFATRLPFQPSDQPGMNISGEGRGCGHLTGKFIVKQVDYNQDGSLKDFAVDFIQHCEGKLPALHGAIRYHSDVPVTFGQI